MSTTIRSRPRRNRTLTPEEWVVLRAEVQERDRQVVMRWLVANGHPIPRSSLQQLPACPAVVMDPSQWGKCWGPWHLDHVKTDLRMGVKAEDEPDKLVDLCAGHDERGARAGFQWNTAHRAEERKYLLDRRRERAARA